MYDKRVVRNSPMSTVASLYAEISVDRMDLQALRKLAYKHLTNYYGGMTDDELIDHIKEMGDGDILEDS
jgi:hypothetical protein